MSNSLWPHELEHTRLLCPSLSSGVCSNTAPLGRWCHPTISSSVTPLCPSLNLSQRQQSALCIRWPNYWFQHQSFQWVFRTDFLEEGLVGSPCSPTDSRQSSPAPPFESINSLAHSFLYVPSLISLHEYCKKQLWLCRTLSVKQCLSFVMCCLFVIDFLPRSKHLLILCLWS